MNTSDYISTTKAAEIAGIDSRHMRRLAETGGIHAVKIGRNYLVVRASATEFKRHPSKGRPKSKPRKGKKIPKKPATSC